MSQWWRIGGVGAVFLAQLFGAAVLWAGPSQNPPPLLMIQRLCKDWDARHPFWEMETTSRSGGALQTRMRLLRSPEGASPFQTVAQNIIYRPRRAVLLYLVANDRSEYFFFPSRKLLVKYEPRALVDADFVAAINQVQDGDPSAALEKLFESQLHQDAEERWVLGLKFKKPLRNKFLLPEGSGLVMVVGKDGRTERVIAFTGPETTESTVEYIPHSRQECLAAMQRWTADVPSLKAAKPSAWLREAMQREFEKKPKTVKQLL